MRELRLALSGVFIGLFLAIFLVGCGEHSQKTTFREPDKGRETERAEAKRREQTVHFFEMTSIAIRQVGSPGKDITTGQKCLWLVKESDSFYKDFRKNNQFVVAIREGLILTSSKDTAIKIVKDNKPHYLTIKPFEVKEITYAEAFQIGPEVGDPLLWRTK